MDLPDTSSPRDLYGLTRAELQQQLVDWGLKPVHANRLWRYLYIDLVSSLDDMTELLPARLRAETTPGEIVAQTVHVARVRRREAPAGACQHQ